jgi:hypothetical protein
MTHRIVSVVVLFVALSWSALAYGQGASRQGSLHLVVSADPPRGEFGLSVSQWNWNGGSWLVNGHVSGNVASWLAVEGALERGRADYTHPNYGMMIIDARLMTPDSVAAPRLFVQAGAAAGVGLSYNASPMIGVGLESSSRGRFLAGRVEFQIFPRGEVLRDHGRFLLGLVILFR